ncbi:MAG: GNAT family N-acetyltransferase, partial [Devosiaceae bacterium]
MTLNADLPAISTRENSAAITTQPTNAQGLSAAASSLAKGYRGVDINTRDALVAIAKDWQRLEVLSEGSTVFQSYDVCLPWLDAYVFCDAPTHRAHVLAFYNENGTMIALAPFAQRIKGMATMAEWIGEPLVQYGDLLMEPTCDVDALRKSLNALLSSWTVSGLHLRNVRADARIHSVLQMEKSAIGEPREAGIIDLSAFESAEAYFDTFSKRSKKNRKKKRRVLDEMGSLTFKTVEAGEEAEALCQKALEWKLTWLAERGFSSRAFMDSRALACLKAACGRKSAHNPIRLFVQSLDDRPIAIEIGLVGSQGNAAFMGTYDPQFETQSAGKVQMESSIMHGFESNWPSYDMLAPMSEYKESWSNKRIGVADYMMPTGLGGL